MKNKNTKRIVLASLAIVFLSFFTSFWSIIDANIASIHVEDTKSLSVTIDKEIEINTESESDVKVFENITIENISVNEQGLIELLTETELTEQTNYSLISVSGVEGNIDFTTSLDTSVGIFTNQDTTSNISEVEVLWDGIIQITTKETLLNASDIEFTLLWEVGISSLQSGVALNGFSVSLEDALKNYTDYIFMVISLKDIQGNDVVFENGIYSFTTQELIPDLNAANFIDLGAEIIGNDEEQEKAKQELLEEDNTDNFVDIGTDMLSEEVESEALSEEQVENETEAEAGTLGEEKTELEQKDIEEVALAMKETPDTGAETNMLFALALLLNTFFYIRKRKKA